MRAASRGLGQVELKPHLAAGFKGTTQEESDCLDLLALNGIRPTDLVDDQGKRGTHGLQVYSPHEAAAR